MTKRIALDLDSTLAATSLTAFELLDEPHYTYDDIESWEWPLETFGKDRFLTAAWHAWTLRPTDVPLLEPDLPTAVNALADEHTVDIVTAHPDYPGISDGKQQWLDHHGFDVNEFVPVHEGTKDELDYDVYIDDKPTLPAAVNDTRPNASVYLRDQPYNRDAPGTYTRVTSLAEVADALCDGGVASD